MPTLLVFGDSWANSSDPTIDTWPEVVARRWGWRLINLAEPHSGSDGLDRQFMQLCRASREHPVPFNEHDLAIVHTGGNDLYYSTPSSLAAVALSGPVANVFAPHIGRSLSAHVKALVMGLLELGVRRIACVGVPLSTHMPFIAQPVAELGIPSVLMCLARCVMRSSNRVLLTALRSALADGQRDSGKRLLLSECLDEASAIDRVLEADAPTSQPAEAEARRAWRASHLWWEDASHPSQALHAALANVMQVQLRAALDAGMVPPRAKEKPIVAATEDDVTVSLLPRTPMQREAIS